MGLCPRVSERSAPSRPASAARTARGAFLWAAVLTGVPSRDFVSREGFASLCLSPAAWKLLLASPCGSEGGGGEAGALGADWGLGAQPSVCCLACCEWWGCSTAGDPGLPWPRHPLPWCPGWELTPELSSPLSPWDVLSPLPRVAGAGALRGRPRNGRASGGQPGLLSCRQRSPPAPHL